MNNSHLYRFTIGIFSIILGISFSWCLFRSSHLRWFQSQSNVSFFNSGYINFETLPNVSLVDLDFSQFKLIFRQNTLNVVTEFYNNSVRVDVTDKTDVFFVLIDLVSVAKKWLFRSFQYLFIVWDFNNFVPLIQTHNSESMALFLRVLSIYFEVWEWNNLSNLSDNNSNFIRSHDLISFKIVVFFYVQFIQSTKIGVRNLTLMNKKLPFSWEEWFLSIF